MNRIVTLALALSLTFLSAYLEGISSSKYRLYCMYTPLFEELYTQYFLPSVKDDFEIVAHVYPQDCPSGAFHEVGWEKTMLYKLAMLEEAILDHWNDQIFFYSDVDIIFLKPIIEATLAHLASKDFVVQQGWPRDGLCAGFFVMRGNERTLQLIRNAYTLLQEKNCIDDQEAIQKALDNFKGPITWDFLPSELYPNGRRVLMDAWGQYTPDSEIILNEQMVLFHANCCVGLKNKYHFLQRVKHTFSLNMYDHL